MAFGHAYARVTELCRDNSHWYTLHCERACVGMPEDVERHRRVDLCSSAGVFQWAGLLRCTPLSVITTFKDKLMCSRCGGQRLKETCAFVVEVNMTGPTAF